MQDITTIPHREDNVNYFFKSTIQVVDSHIADLFRLFKGGDLLNGYRKSDSQPAKPPVLFKKNRVKKNNSFLKLVSLALFIVLTTTCSKEHSPEPIADYQKLDEAFSIAQQFGNFKSLVVFHNDTLIKEAFSETGGADTRHDVRSVTKSVIGLLIGIAIDKGYLNSIDQTLGEFIDPLTYTITSEKAAIRICHLLTMSSGFEWDELTSVSGYNNWILSDNQVQYLLDKPLVQQPYQQFNYNSAALHLLSVIITKATRMSTHDFAIKYLFEPLGIAEIEWQIDKQGYNNGAAGLKITPHDMVKIGQLLLNHGVYNGKIIVSSEYSDQSIQSKISTNGTQFFSSSYGYCWWIGQNDNGNYAFANGYGGQFIVVFPDLDLVVVATNQWSGIRSNVANDQWYKTLDLILNRIVPVFSDQPDSQDKNRSDF